MRIRRVRADEGDAYRAVRLRALRDAPYAYSTTLAEALARAPSDWPAMVARGAGGDQEALFVIDREDGTLAGTAFVAMRPATGDAFIFQMWVDEDLRGQAWAADLIGAAERFALEHGASACELGVEEDNPRAFRFYERLGYRPTGETEPNPRGGQTISVRRPL